MDTIQIKSSMLSDLLSGLSCPHCGDTVAASVSQSSFSATLAVICDDCTDVFSHASPNTFPPVPGNESRRGTSVNAQVYVSLVNNDGLSRLNRSCGPTGIAPISTRVL